MRKAELESALCKEREKCGILRSALFGIRQVSRDCIKSKSNINEVWIIENITAALTKADLL